MPRLQPGLIARPRLISRLDEVVPLTVLHAAAGYGKTVVLTQWATRTEQTGVWLRVRQGSAEPVGFVELLSHALDDAGMVDDRSPLATARESLQVADPWVLLERGLRRIDRELTVVIDESEHLHHTTVHGILRLLADLPQFTVKTSTRTANPFTETGIAVTMPVVRIGVGDLGLTPRETAEMLGENERSERVREVLDLGASPALARVIALGASGEDGDSESAIEARMESLLRLRTPVMDDRFASFVLRVALTDAIDAEFAAELTGEDDAAALLTRAEVEGLGAWNAAAPHAPGLRTFELSPVFRRIIERHARRELPTATLRDLDMRIAQWHRDQERPFPALRIAVTWKEWELATDLARENWYEILRSGQELQDIFAEVPLMTLRNLPLITIVLAIHANAVGTQRLRAVEYFAIASYGARAQRSKARPADRALLRTIESAANRVSGRADPALVAALDGLDIMRTIGPAERDRLGRNESTIYNQLGTTLLYADRIAEALECFRASIAIGDVKGLFAGLQGMALKTGTLAISGDMPEAAESLAEVDRRTWPDGWMDGYPGSFAQLARGYLALENGDPDAAAESLAILDRHRRTIEHWAALMHLDALVALLKREPEAGLIRLDTTLREQRARHAAHGRMVAGLKHTRALLELARGDAAAAEEALVKVPIGPRRYISRARIALAAGDLDRARRMLAGVDDQAPDSDALSSRLRAEYLALAAGTLALADDGASPQGGSPSVQGALRTLAAFLEDRGQTLALALTPVGALAAMTRAAEGGELADWFVAALRRSRDIGAIGSRRMRPRLTERELAVAGELTRHASIADIAAAMSVSRNTVKTQLRALYRKLDVGSRDEALHMLAAWDLGATPRDAD